MRRSIVLHSIRALLQAFDENGINYCHWKSNEHLEEALDGDTDLDILFDPFQRTELEMVMDKCGLKRFRATPLMQYNAIEDFIGFDQEAAKIWHVHTHYRMTLGEKHLKGYTVTPWGKIILDDRIQNAAGIWTSSPADELVLLLCRIALELRWRDIGWSLGKDDRAEIQWLLSRTTKDDIRAASEKLLTDPSVNTLDRLLQENLTKKKQFLGLQRVLRKELKPYTSYNRFTSWFVRSKREVFWLFGGIKRRIGRSNYSANRRISPSGGLVAAILGCDGAGKSTTLSYVKKEFNKKLDVVSIYYGSGDGSSSLIRKPMKLVAKKVGGKGVGHAVEKEYSENRKLSLKSRLYSAAKVVWALALAREKKTKLRQMVKARNNGILVLTDRYPQSAIPGAGDGPLLSQYRGGKGLLKRLADWEQSIYESFSYNPPDLTIKLVVPTEVAIERKPEMSIEEIEKKKDIVMKMKLSDHTTIIDTSEAFEITRGKVMKAIWDLM